MGVNLHLLPAKGMTLPFISYGGSALLSSAVTMGFLLALSRRYADARVTVGAAPAARGGGLRAGLGATGAPRRRRHRRPSLSGAGAPRGAGAARLGGARRDRSARRRAGRRRPGGGAAPHPVGDVLAVGSPVRHAALGRRRWRSGVRQSRRLLKRLRPVDRRRLRRLPDRAAGRRGAARAASRSSCMSRTPSSDAPTGCCSASARRSPPASRTRRAASARVRSRPCRQPGAQGDRRGGAALRACRAATSRSACSSSAAARARTSSPSSSPRALALLPPEKPLARIAVVQQARPEDVPATREAFASIGVEAEVAAVLHRHGRAARRRASRHLPRRRLDASPSSR